MRKPASWYNIGVDLKRVFYGGRKNVRSIFE